MRILLEKYYDETTFSQQLGYLGCPTGPGNRFFDSISCLRLILVVEISSMLPISSNPFEIRQNWCPRAERWRSRDELPMATLALGDTYQWYVAVGQAFFRYLTSIGISASKCAKSYQIQSATQLSQLDSWSDVRLPASPGSV